MIRFVRWFWWSRFVSKVSHFSLHPQILSISVKFSLKISFGGATGPMWSKFQAGNCRRLCAGLRSPPQSSTVCLIFTRPYEWILVKHFEVASPKCIKLLFTIPFYHQSKTTTDAAISCKRSSKEGKALSDEEVAKTSKSLTAQGGFQCIFHPSTHEKRGSVQPKQKLHIELLFYTLYELLFCALHSRCQVARAWGSTGSGRCWNPRRGIPLAEIWENWLLAFGWRCHAFQHRQAASPRTQTTKRTEVT